MKPEDIGPILAIEESRQRKLTRKKWEDEFRIDYNSSRPSQRCMRAYHFANQMLALMRDFVPDACRDAAFEELAVNAYGSDLEIVQVPPERDATAAAELRRLKVTLSPTMIIPK